ncbi:MAG: hypothetical protein ACPLRJ_03760 [Infirmifilum uzonense]|uniref:hypothetical protein n=1 Tax=Infirmifilum uzonense TaxID=1550241 RepID=UPI003C7317CC
MMRKLLVTLVFLYFLVSLVESLNAMTPNTVNIKPLYANTSSVVNVTVSVLTCDGGKLDPNYLKYLRVEIKGNETYPSAGEDTKLFQIPPGNYSIIVEYLGSIVSRYNLSVVNNTKVTLKANITRVDFKVMGLLSSQPLRGYTLSVDTFGLLFNSGSSDTVSVWLPFGNIQYTVIYRWGDWGNTTASGNLRVSCSSNLAVVRLPVWNILYFGFSLNDGSSVLGLDGSAEVYYLGKLTGKIDFKSDDKLKLEGALTGPYTIRIYLHGKKIGEKTVIVDEKSWQYNVSVNVLRNLFVRLNDANNRPLVSQDLVGEVRTPIGIVVNQSLGESNVIIIPQTTPGDYNLRITSTLIGVVYDGKFTVTSDSAEIQLPLLYTSLIFKPEASSVIPRDISVRVFYISGGKEILLWTTTSLSDGSESIKRVPLSVLPVGSSVKVEVLYAGIKYTSFSTVSGVGSIQVTLPLYDLIIKVYDRNGDPLSGCSLNLTAGNLQLSTRLRGGQAFFPSIPKSDARVTVVCKGVTVIDEIIPVASGNITLTAPLTTLRVVVKSWFDRPVVGSRVTVTLFSGNRTLYSASDVTDQSGTAFLTDIPVLPGSQLMLRVEYGSYVYIQRLQGDENTVRVFLDILIDTPLLKLSFSQVIITGIIFLSLGLATVIVLRRHEHISAFKNMFEVGAGEEEEKESLIQRLKNLFRKKKEEEEEEDIFF